MSLERADSKVFRTFRLTIFWGFVLCVGRIYEAQNIERYQENSPPSQNCKKRELRYYSLSSNLLFLRDKGLTASLWVPLEVASQ
mmetsp:Transcript_29744/g.33825  ORF Transcript_29744/g.33825 Transcript_29744/m.33825 type:complete len:84 (+) Transcript_29744:142-393(+)